MFDERYRFMQEVLRAEESFAALCRSYGISRKTGYKWRKRYLEDPTLSSLEDRSRRPQRCANQVSSQIEEAILELRARRPHWGERKLAAWLKRERAEQAWPAPSTIGAILKRHGLTHARKRRARATPSAQLSAAEAPNQVWAIDFKGWFRTGDGQRCDPLTMSDLASRYLLRCQAVERPDFAHVKALLEASFRQYGLPQAMRSDNGAPFATTGLGGLSRLSVWWLRLGVRPERIEPGRPQQNGVHERMHRTLKQETASPPAASSRAQQRVFDRFQRDFNEQRPHEALQMATPASVYVASAREYPERLPELEYPDGFERRRVQEHGDVQFKGRAFFVSEVLAGETIGFEESESGWRVWFGPLLLGLLDGDSLRGGARPSLQRSVDGGVSARPPGSLQRPRQQSSGRAQKK